VKAVVIDHSTPEPTTSQPSDWNPRGEVTVGEFLPRMSAGLLIYRVSVDGEVDVLLVHPGGPFWARRDEGAWSIPKGEYEISEDPLAASSREFEEELGSAPPAGVRTDLGEVRQASGKRIRAWAVEGDFDASTARSNTFSLEWPPRSGAFQEFPEVDRAAWESVAVARRKLVSGQVPFLDRLLAHIAAFPSSLREIGHDE